MKPLLIGLVIPLILVSQTASQRMFVNVTDENNSNPRTVEVFDCKPFNLKELMLILSASAHRQTFIQQVETFKLLETPAVGQTMFYMGGDFATDKPTTITLIAATDPTFVAGYRELSNPRIVYPSQEVTISAKEPLAEGEYLGLKVLTPAKISGGYLVIR